MKSCNHLLCPSGDVYTQCWSKHAVFSATPAQKLPPVLGIVTDWWKVLAPLFLHHQWMTGRRLEGRHVMVREEWVNVTVDLLGPRFVWNQDSEGLQHSLNGVEWSAEVPKHHSFHILQVSSCCGNRHLGSFHILLDRTWLPWTLRTNWQLQEQFPCGGTQQTKGKMAAMDVMPLSSTVCTCICHSLQSNSVCCWLAIFRLEWNVSWSVCISRFGMMNILTNLCIGIAVHPPFLLLLVPFEP